MLARGGIKLRNVSWDTFELATLLVPEAAVYNLRAIAGKLNVTIDTSRAHRAVADAELAMNVFLALRERIEEIPLEVLAEIGKATERSDWPLRHLFREVEYEKSRDVFTSGSSIRSQLASKGLSDAELDVGFLYPPDGADFEPELFEELQVPASRARSPSIPKRSSASLSRAARCRAFSKATSTAPSRSKWLRQSPTPSTKATT